VIKKKGTKVPVSFCVCFAVRQAEIKERNQKGRCLFVCVCALLVKIRNGIKDLDLFSCTAVFIDLGKMSVTIWTNGSWEN